MQPHLRSIILSVLVLVASAVMMADGRCIQCDCADVVLHVPHLVIDYISLKVSDLYARVDLNVKLLDLLKLSGGASIADSSNVDLELEGVTGSATFNLRLDKVSGILGEALNTAQQNPGILSGATGLLNSRLNTALGGSTSSKRNVQYNDLKK